MKSSVSRYLSQQTLPQGTKWQDWRERKASCSCAVRMERTDGIAEPHRGGSRLFNIITSATR